MVFIISSPFLSIFLTSFIIGTEKILYFSVFSPGQLNSSSNYFRFFYDKMITIVRLVRFTVKKKQKQKNKKTGIPLGILNFELHMICEHLCIY